MNAFLVYHKNKWLNDSMKAFMTLVRKEKNDLCELEIREWGCHKKISLFSNLLRIGILYIIFLPSFLDSLRALKKYYNIPYDLA